MVAYRGKVPAQERPGSRLTDAGLSAVVLVAAELAIVASREPGSISRSWLAYALGAAMALPVLLRRRAPLLEVYLVGLALLVYYAIGYPGFPPAVVLAVPLYDAAYAGRAWRALPVPLLLLGTGVIVALRKGTAPLDAVDVFLPQFALVAVALLLGALVRSRQAYAAESQERLRAVAAEQERESERRVAAERLRIARELHDTVAHALSTITVQSGTALFMLDQQPDKAREALTAIRQTGKEALGEMRTTLGVLRSPGEPAVTPEHNAGLGRLPALLTAVASAGLEVDLTNDLTADVTAALPAPVDHAAYRIVQEALTNVLRHAGPSARAQVQLRRSQDNLEVEVTDDGTGPADGHTGGHGLKGMAERTAALGGRLQSGAAAGGGFRIHATLPLGGDE
ncbi:sensor histidine kinase [Kribbella sp. NPDC026611]|uniref:sensor histidine kinase n=1 Tax=Kribbella sp. NPDC026611 TaxID=3154911 RepID=UPI0033FF4633